MTCIRTLLALVILFGVIHAPARAQFFSEINHPELEWFDIKTEHFEFTYHDGLEAFARRVAKVAEEVYVPITRLYDYEPSSKPRILVRDIDDANRSAYYPGMNTIDFWATGLTHDFELRGAKTDWVRNVFTHEFTHLISTHVSRKASSRIQGLYLQTFLYQDENRREDVTTGLPNVISSVIYPSEILPPWFTEGTAQYMAVGAQYDTWDSHRDMILRQATLNDQLLTYDEMGAFGGKTGLGFEHVYDHGYSLTLYIVNRFGENALHRLYRAMRKKWRIDFDGAVNEALGISGRALYDGWKASLEERYRLQMQAVAADSAVGILRYDKGTMNLHPRWSPSGDSLAFLSTAGQDYGRLSLVTLANDDSTAKPAAGNARSAFDWSPDGNHLLFARRSSENKLRNRYWDLYTVDPSDSSGVSAWRRTKGFIGLDGGLAPGQERLTHGARSVHPRYSPNGETVAFVENGRGFNDLALLDVATGNASRITCFTDGSQVHTPDYSPDGKHIAFSLFAPSGDRSVAIIPATGGEHGLLVRSAGTDRDPAWTADGNLLFSSDQDGIFNLYHLNLETAAVHRITRVPGGALHPDPHPKDGRIAFAHYGNDGYEIRVIDGKGLWEPVPTGVFDVRVPAEAIVPEDLSSVPESKPYNTDFMGLSLSPRVALDVGKLKVGFYAFSSESLGKQSLFIQGLLSHDRDLELFATYEYKGWRPTFYASAFRVTHHVEKDIANRDRDGRVFNRTFSLNGLIFGLKHRLRRGGLLDFHLEYDRFGNSVDQSRFNGQNRGAIGATFLNGINLSLSYSYQNTPPAIDSEISPNAGRSIFLGYDRYFNFFLKGFEPNTTIVIEQFQNFFYDQFEVDWNEYLKGPGDSSIGLRFYGGWMGDIVNDAGGEDYFDFRLGGLPFLKGYTFFSIEGSRAALFRGAWRFPLWREINQQTGPVYSNQVFGSFYGGLGRAWDGTSDDDILLRGWKKDAGFQLRYEGTSFYQYPLAISLDAAYGFNAIPLQDPTDSVERSGLKLYFTVMFGFFQTVGAR